jgi:multidrug efflux pump subunit AcrA (membrane-fusion protein)
MAVDYPDAYPSWKSFAASIRSDASLPSLPTIANDQLRQYLSVRNILPSYYNIQSQEERLKKYVIKAPYSGILSEAMVDPGTMVRAGQKIGTYVNRAAYELEASLSLNDLNYLKTGSKVRLNTEQKDQSYIGTLSRVNTVVDPLTQMVSAFLRVEGQELREGLYLQAEILGGVAENAYEVKRQMLQGTQLYLVGRDSSLYLKEVEIISFNGENAIIRGLESGDMMPVRMVPGAFEGLKVIPEIQNDSKKGA